jgi:hypothetical protein|tara:strand:+ start:119 stop:1966 length:1848 start_codon:yes stop_codon:yes gene_type:complete
MNKNDIKKLNILMTISLWVLGVGLFAFFSYKIYNYAVPTTGERNRFITFIGQGILQVAIKMIQNIVRLYEIISTNYLKSGIIFSTIVYLLISFFAYPVGPMFKSGSFKFITRTGNTSFDSRSGFLLATNILWILLGTALLLGTFSLTYRTRQQTNPYPANSGFLSRLSWTFYSSLFDLKVFSGMVIVMGFMIGLLYLISKFRILSLSISVLLQIFSVIALLFMTYRWVNSHPQIKRKLENNTILKILYHIIFALPCLVGFMGEGFYASIKQTPSVVWIVLLLEIITLIVYFIIPILRNSFYTTDFNSRDNSLTKSQAQTGISSAITITERKITSIQSQLNIDWDKILKKKLYKAKKSDDLISYLKKNGFKEHYENNNNILSLVKAIFISSPAMTLSAAKTFIQANGSILRKLHTEEKQLNNKYKHYLEKANKVFTSKILLSKPEYTDKMKVIGTFENLKGDLGLYNYQYSLSAWIFLHEQPPSKSYANNKFTSIIDYGNKPNIKFNPSEGILQVVNQQGKNDTEVVYQTKDILLQKWNNIVINYEGGTLDIFINGNLVASKNNIIPYMSYDRITLGNDEGVSGGASAIIYYNKPLTKRQIEFFYNSLKNENPPSV